MSFSIDNLGLYDEIRFLAMTLTAFCSVTYENEAKC